MKQTAFTNEECDKYDLDEYNNTLLYRFKNDKLDDCVSRLRIDGGHKIQTIFSAMFKCTDHNNDIMIPIQKYFEYIDATDLDSIQNDYIGVHLKLNFKSQKERMTYLFGKTAL